MNEDSTNDEPQFGKYQSETTEHIDEPAQRSASSHWAEHHARVREQSRQANARALADMRNSYAQATDAIPREPSSTT